MMWLGSLWRERVFLSSLIAVLLPAAAWGASLHVTSFPSGADVWVDGVFTGEATPMSTSLTEGDHEITVQIPNSGWNPDVRQVAIMAGKNELSVTLLPLLTQGPPGPSGEQGIAGPVGPVGPQGEPGSSGGGGIVLVDANGDVVGPVVTLNAVNASVRYDLFGTPVLLDVNAERIYYSPLHYDNPDCEGVGYFPVVPRLFPQYATKNNQVYLADTAAEPEPFLFHYAWIDDIAECFSLGEDDPFPGLPAKLIGTKPNFVPPFRVSFE